MTDPQETLSTAMRRQTVKDRIAQLADAGARVLEFTLVGQSITVRTSVARTGDARPLILTATTTLAELDRGLFRLWNDVLELNKQAARTGVAAHPVDS